MLVERYLKILDDMTMVPIYVKTSTSTINVANHRAKGGWCDINHITYKKRGAIYASVSSPGSGVGGGGGIIGVGGKYAGTPAIDIDRQGANPPYQYDHHICEIEHIVLLLCSRVY